MLIISGYGDSRYTIREGGGWVNLTIGRVRVQDRGELTCVAKSPGGVDERNITLIVPGSGVSGTTNKSSDNWPLFLGLITGLIALAVVVLTLCCCLCRKSPTQPRPKKLPETPNGDLSHPEKSLLTVVNPVQKPPRRYEDRPTELTEQNRNLLDDTGMLCPLITIHMISVMKTCKSPFFLCYFEALKDVFRLFSE